MTTNEEICTKFETTEGESPNPKTSENEFQNETCIEVEKDKAENTKRESDNIPQSSDREPFESKIRVDFTKDIKGLLFGFGDVREPDVRTVTLLNAIAIDYIQKVTLVAMAHHDRLRGQAPVNMTDGCVHFPAFAVEPGTYRLRPEDLLYVARKDRRKRQRATELIELASVVK